MDAIERQKNKREQNSGADDYEESRQPIIGTDEMPEKKAYSRRFYDRDQDQREVDGDPDVRVYSWKGIGL